MPVTFALPEVDGQENAAPNLHEPRTFRATPHPSKKLCVANDNEPALFSHDMNPNDMSMEGDENLPMEETEKEGEKTCSTEESDEDKENTAPEDEEKQEEEEPQDEGKEWNAICQEIRNEENPVSCDNLKLFEESSLRHETSLSNFGRTIEEFQSALDAIMERFFTKVTAPIYQAQRDRMDALEADIIQSMQQNHKRRTKLVQALENHNKKWETSYNKLMGKILQVPVEEESTQGDLEPKDQDNGPSEANGKDSDDLDPDWEELAQYEPTQENIRRFLEERERFRAADEHFRLTLDDIYANLKMTFEKMVHVAAEVHESVAETMDEKQVDIQQHMASNLQRRQELQNALEEKAKLAQGMFASLMARVTTSFQRSMQRSDNKRKATESAE